MKRSNRYVASAILIIVTVGYFITYPFSASFVGQLLNALFGAAMIGGVADWFGITALFRKPFGIPFKTELIPKGREKIFEALSDMVQNDLLSKEALLTKLDSFVPSQSVLYYIDKQGGEKEILALVNTLSADLLSYIPPEEAVCYIKSIIKNNPESYMLAPLLESAFNSIAEKGINDQLAGSLTSKIDDLLTSRSFSALLEETIESLMQDFKESINKENAGKRLLFKLAITFSGYSDLSPAKLSKRLMADTREFIGQLKDKNSSERKQAAIWLEKVASDFISDPSVRENIEAKKTDLICSAVSSPYFAGKLSSFLDGGDNTPRLSDFIVELANKALNDFRNNPDQQKHFDAYIKNLLKDAVLEHHSAVGRLVRQKLEMFSNDMLVEMIEDNAGNDLQIIRINGSLVGGLTGVAIFLLTNWL